LIIVVSTVALLVEVPANGNNENATFPRGHDIDEVSAGEGTANAVVDDNDDAKTGSFGIIKVDAATPTIPCTAPRLPIVVLVEVDFWPFSAEES